MDEGAPKRNYDVEQLLSSEDPRDDAMSCGSSSSSGSDSDSSDERRYYGFRLDDRFMMMSRELPSIDEVSNEDASSGICSVYASRLSPFEESQEVGTEGSIHGQEADTDESKEEVDEECIDRVVISVDANNAEKAAEAEAADTVYSSEDYEFYDYTFRANKERRLKLIAMLSIAVLVIACILISMKFTIWQDTGNGEDVTDVLAQINSMNDNASSSSPSSANPTSQSPSTAPPTVASSTPPPTQIETSPPPPGPPRTPNIPNTPSSSAPFEYIFDVLRERAPQSILLNKTTVQGQAFSHLVSEEATAVNATPPVQVRQRYSMLTIFFSISPNKWNTRFPWWALEENECYWDGVVTCLQITDGSWVVDGINLSGYDFEGQIPREICDLPFLENLNLSGNKLVGSIPSCLSDSLYLKTLDVRNNSLGGMLPSGLLLVPTLESIQLSNNTVKGGLDVLFDGLFYNNIFRYAESWRIRKLNLDNNRLYGNVPTSLGALRKIQSLTLHGNNLVGKIDLTLCEMLESEQDLLEELTADCGPTAHVSCSCCTKCY